MRCIPIIMQRPRCSIRNPSSDAHNLPWAFCVPYDKFYWPLHAVAIGYQVTSKRFLYGAYPYLWTFIW